MNVNFEVNNSVVDANELLAKVRQNILKISEDSNQPEVTFVGESDRNNAAVSLAYEKIIQISDTLDMMLENIQIMNRTWYHMDAKLGAKVKWLKPIVVFFKRAVRKMVYWFTQPYVEQQSSFNGAVTRAVSDSLRAQRELLDALKQK